MAKFLDENGLSYFYGKLKSKFSNYVYVGTNPPADLPVNAIWINPSEAGSSSDSSEFLIKRTDSSWGPFSFDTGEFVGATTTTAGTSGSVPAPAAGMQNKFLCSDATWKDAGGLPVGHEFFTTNPNIPAGCIPLLGGEYSRTAYADLWAWVQTQQGYLIEESAWQAKAAANGGNVPFYSKGDGSTTFRVPALKCWVRGADSISEVGGYLAAGLPNIEGQLGLWGTEKRYSTTSGAFSTNNGELDYGAGHTKDGGLIADFNASLSNPIYGSSDTVQPPSIVGMWLVKAYGTVTNIGSTDVANIAQGLTELETRLLGIFNSAGHLVLPDGSEFWIA